MPHSPDTISQLRRELDETRSRLAEAEEALNAIRSGEVDGLVVAGPEGQQVFTLKGAQEPYRLLIEQMSEGALTLSREGVILYANQTFARLLQTPLERVIGAELRTFVGPADQPALAELIEAAWRGSSRGEMDFRVADGSSIPLRLGLHRLQLDPETLVCVVATDLTEARKKEAELRQLHADLEKRVEERTADLAASRLAAQNMMEEAVEAREETQRSLERIHALHEIDAAITSTLDLRAVLHVLVEKTVQLLPYSASLVWLRNPQTGSLERAACWSLDEKEWKERKLTGTPLLVKTIIDTRTPIAIRNLQTDPRTMDSDFYRKEGLVSYLGIPLIAKNKVVGVLIFLTREEHEFARDETEFLVTLAGQAAIAIHNSQLYEEMRNMAGSLAKSNRVKDEFLSVMSHELRTPLTAVVGYTGLLQDGTLQGIGQEKALQKIMKHSGELLSMINSILQASTLEANEVTARMHEIHPSRILDDIRSAYDFPLENELTLHWDYAPDLPVIRTDGGKLKQILQNLINNAIKFTEKGTVTVSARITFAPLLPSSSAGEQGGRGAGEQGGNGAGGSFVEFRVADTGVGIAKESLPIVFEMFRQVDSSETRLYGGVGLGLFIAKKFTELLGGTVEVESEPDRGSTFTVRIPC